MTKVSILNTRGISDNKFDTHCHLTLNRAIMFINDYICIVLVLPILQKVISPISHSQLSLHILEGSLLNA